MAVPDTLLPLLVIAEKLLGHQSGAFFGFVSLIVEVDVSGLQVCAKFSKYSSHSTCLIATERTLCLSI